MAQPVHELAPPALYVPLPHLTAVALVEPAGQAYPAAHTPLQLLLDRPVAAPKTPAGHNVHIVAPRASLYCPMGHGIAVAFVDPVGQ